MTDLSIPQNSKEVYLSPNYISMLFKQNAGETFSDYLTKTRINNAKILLETTDFKVLEIAEMVGYKSSHYFSTVFKKSTGVHPQKYRNITNKF